MADVRDLRDKAIKLTTSGKLDAALVAWRELGAKAPDDISVQQKIAEVLAKLGRTAEAVKSYEDVANRYAQQGLFFKASAVSKLVLALDPNHKPIQELIASLYARGVAEPPPAPQPPPSDAATAKPVSSLPPINRVRTEAMMAPTPPPPRPAEPPRLAPVEAMPEIEAELVINEALPPTKSGLPSIPLFSTLSEDELSEVLKTAMEVRAHAEGNVIVAEGAPGTSMYALVEGTAGVFRGWGTAEQRRVAELGAGDIFGEAAMVTGAPRIASVVADGPAMALEFPREAMQGIVRRFPHVGQMLATFYRQRLLANALRASTILRTFSDADKKALAATLQPCTWKDGQKILIEGQPVEAVHLLLRGACAVTHSTGERYGDLREGDLFGEISVLTERPASATVTAVGTALTMRVSSQEFKARLMANPDATLAVKRVAVERLNRTKELNKQLAESGSGDSRV